MEHLTDTQSKNPTITHRWDVVDDRVRFTHAVEGFCSPTITYYSYSDFIKMMNGASIVITDESAVTFHRDL